MVEEHREPRTMLVSAVVNALITSIEKKVPEKGIFGPVCWSMSYYGTEYGGRLYCEYSQTHGCRIRASMLMENSGRETSNYLFSGSKHECIDWLQADGRVEELIEIYNHLMEKADGLE